MSNEATITVSGAAALKSALAAARGGETILLEAGDYGRLALKGGFDSTVTIRAADSAATASFSSMRLDNVRNLTFEDVTFDYVYAPGDPLWLRPFAVHGGQDVTFSGVRFLGDDAYGSEDAASNGFPTGVGIHVRDSRDVTVEDSLFEGFMRGALMSHNDGIVFRGNEIRDIRSDGLNLPGTSNALIENNHFHSFRVAPDSNDHKDMLQIWTRGITESQGNITIRGNLFDSGSGDRTQTILIRDEDGIRYYNIVIEDNTILNGHLHGITVEEVDGLTVRDNTLLQSEIQGNAPNAGVWQPRINISEGSTNVIAENNVTHGGINGHADQADWTVANNLSLQRHNPDAPGYYGDNFVAPFSGGIDNTAAFQVLPGSVLDLSGAGSARLAYDPQPDTPVALIRSASQDMMRNAVDFDATFSAGPDGPLATPDATVTWDFGDGHTGSGVTPSHVYGAPGTYTVTLTIDTPDGAQATSTQTVVIATPDVVSFDAARGVFVAHTPDGTRDLDSPETFLLDDGSHAVDLQNGAFKLPRNAFDGLFGTDSFTIGASIRMPGGSQNSGEVLIMPQSLAISVNDRGDLGFKIIPDGGSKWIGMSAQGVRLIDGHWHDIEVDWDGVSGALRLSVDGVVRAERTVEGVLKGKSHFDMTIGSAFGSAFTGQIRALEIEVGSDRWAFEDASNMASPPPTLFADTVFTLETDAAALAAQARKGLEIVAGPDDAVAVSLAGGGHLEIGRLDALEGTQTLSAELTFRLTEAGAADRGMLLHNHMKLHVELLDDRLKFSIGTEDGGMYRAMTGRLGVSDDTDLHTLRLAIDAVAGTATAFLDGAQVWSVTGQAFDLTNGPERGWVIGDRWNGTSSALEVTGLRLSDHPDVFGPDAFGDVGMPLMAFPDLLADTIVFDDAPLADSAAPAATIIGLDMTAALLGFQARNGLEIVNGPDAAAAVSLAAGGHLDIGRLHALEGAEALSAELTFRRTEDGATDRGMLLHNHKKLHVELVGDRLKISIGTEDGGMLHATTGRLGVSDDTDLHTLRVAVDAATGSATAFLDGAQVWSVTGQAFDLTNGPERGWVIGDRWGGTPSALEVTGLRLSDHPDVFGPDAFGDAPRAPMPDLTDPALAMAGLSPLVDVLDFTGMLPDADAPDPALVANGGLWMPGAGDPYEMIA